MATVTTPITIARGVKHIVNPQTWPDMRAAAGRNLTTVLNGDGVTYIQTFAGAVVPLGKRFSSNVNNVEPTWV